MNLDGHRPGVYSKLLTGCSAPKVRLPATEALVALPIMLT